MPSWISCCHAASSARLPEGALQSLRLLRFSTLLASAHPRPFFLNESRLVFRLRIAFFLPAGGTFGVAACKCRAPLQGRVVRGIARPLETQRPRRDRRQAPFHLPARAMACVQTRYSSEVPAVAPLQPVAVVTAHHCAWQPARNHPQDLPFHLARWATAGFEGEPCDACKDSRSDRRRAAGSARLRTRGQGRFAQERRIGNRARCVWRAHTRRWRRTILGFDATDMALDYLNADPLFASPELQRISDLPYGAVRRAAKP